MNDPRSVLALLESAPAILLPLVLEIPEEFRKRRPQSGKWSAHEHAVHLLLLQTLIRGRLEQILAEDRARIAPWHLSPEEEAGLLERDLEEALGIYARERAEMVARLRDLSPEQWERAGDHPEFEGYTVFTMIRGLALHDAFHTFRIDQIRMRRSWPPQETEKPEVRTPRPAAEVVPGSRAAMVAGQVNLLGPFEVPGLAPRTIRVYLPRDYTPEEPSYAIYLFDGQNVFDDRPSFSGGWHVHEAIEKLTRAGRPAPVAIGIDHGGPGRNLELSPFEFDGQPGQAPLLLDWVTGELMPALTAELNPIPGPLGAVVGGSSMGGLCSLWSHFHYPHAFGGALVMSPSFWLADQAIFADVTDQPVPEVSRIYLDAGAREDRGRLLPIVAAMAALLAGRDYDDDRLLWRPDAKGAHNEASWRRRLPKALRFFYR